MTVESADSLDSLLALVPWCLMQAYIQFRPAKPQKFIHKGQIHAIKVPANLCYTCAFVYFIRLVCSHLSSLLILLYMCFCLLYQNKFQD